MVPHLHETAWEPSMDSKIPGEAGAKFRQQLLLRVGQLRRRRVDSSRNRRINRLYRKQLHSFLSMHHSDEGKKANIGATNAYSLTRRDTRSHEVTEVAGNGCQVPSRMPPDIGNDESFTKQALMNTESRISQHKQNVKRLTLDRACGGIQGRQWVHFIIQIV